MLRKLKLALYFNIFSLWAIVGGSLWIATTVFFLQKLESYSPWLLSLFSIGLIEIYWGVKGFFGTPDMLETYDRLHKQFETGKIKKYILYDMKNFPCYSMVTHKLCKEFDIDL